MWASVQAEISPGLLLDRILHHSLTPKASANSPCSAFSRDAHSGVPTRGDAEKVQGNRISYTPGPRENVTAGHEAHAWWEAS